MFRLRYEYKSQSFFNKQAATDISRRKSNESEDMARTDPARRDGYETD